MSPTELPILGERVTRGLDIALAVGTAAILAWGVLALDWSPFIVMALFWFENVVLGAFNVVKMLVVGARLGAPGLLGAIGVAAFFTVHYGLFTLVHGMFVLFLFGGELGRSNANGGLFTPLLVMLSYLLSERDGWLAVLAIVLVHLSGTVQWLARHRELGPSVKDLMSAPYGRIMVLHVTLIAGGFLVQAFGAPMAGALLLVALKLVYDLRTLARERVSDGELEAREKVRRLLVIGRRADGQP